MHPSHRLPSSALLLTCLVALSFATPAQARFGKASSGKQERKSDSRKATKASKKKSDERRVVEAEPSGPVHQARPVRQRSHVNARHPSTIVVAPVPVHTHLSHESCGYDHGYAYGYVAPAYAPAPTTHVHASAEEGPGRERLQTLELTFDVQPVYAGAGASFRGLLDLEHFGLFGAAEGYTLLADDGSGELDTLRLLSAGATWPILDGARGRVRFHLGLHGAMGPEVGFFGPGAGLSGTVRIAGPLHAAGRVSAVLFPYTELDTQGGLALRFGPFQVQGGLRALVLGDQGRVDGIAHTDLLVGPYAGLGLAF